MNIESCSTLLVCLYPDYLIIRLTLFAPVTRRRAKNTFVPITKYIAHLVLWIEAEMPPSRRVHASAPVDKYFPSNSLVIGTNISIPLLSLSNFPLHFFSALPFLSHLKKSKPFPIIHNHCLTQAQRAGAGVTIFHLATNRIVICRDTRSNVYFLPKGRKDASEEITTTAIREGFEESGYRCRLLPLPLDHLQPSPAGGTLQEQKWVIEPTATRMMPVARDYQYMLFWYAAETIPEQLEDSLNAVSMDGFAVPEAFPDDITLKEREKLDVKGTGIYEPKRHEGTGVDEDEAFYVGQLVGVEEAIRLLGGTSADVVRRAWEGICLRRKLERQVKV